MKNSCDIIRDLLPLYIDDAASPSSRQLVEEHLAGCAGCRSLLGRMKNDEAESLIAAEKENVIAGQRRSFRRRSAVIGGVIAGIFMIPVLICLIADLASGAGLGWFFIVLASLLTAASLTVVPLTVPENRGLWTIGCFTVSLLLLLAVCCLYTGGRWFFVAASAVLFGLAVILLPFVVKNDVIAGHLAGRQGLAVMTADTVLYAVMMITIGLHTKAPGFFPVAAAISVPAILLAWGLFAVLRHRRTARSKTRGDRTTDQNSVSGEGEHDMKHSSMLWPAAAVCLVIAVGAVFCLNRWDLSLFGRDKMETNTYDIREAFQSIAVRSDTEDVSFCLSDDGTCRVVCREKEKEKHDVSVRNGTLFIERVDRRKWYERFSLFLFETPSITIYLPQAEYAALSVDSGTGDITLPEGLLFGSVDIGLSTGDVDCRASSSGMIRVKTSTGDIRLEGVSAGALDLTVSTGRVDVLSVVCGGRVGVAVSTGRAELTDITCTSVESTGSTGDITLKNVIASQTISIERSTGGVRFERCDAGELTITTDTGSVTGSLLSDKVFIARTDTGRIDVPETVTGGICRITTDTGDIRITTENK